MRKWLGRKLRDKLGITELQVSLREQLDFTSAMLSVVSSKYSSLSEQELKQIRDELCSLHGDLALDGRIHKYDIMFQHHLFHSPDLFEANRQYFKVGAGIASGLSQLAYSHEKQYKSLLDFGSGYGRVSRFLPSFFKDVDITISEVKEEAGRFQKETFNYNTIIHGTNPADFPQAKFDLIIALSVFTHLPEGSFISWFKTLTTSLTENGVLLISLNQLRNTERKTSGFQFTHQSEDSSFSTPDRLSNQEEYGLTFVTQDYMRELASKNDLELHWHNPDFLGTQEMIVLRRK